MNHLDKIKYLSLNEIEEIMDLALLYKNGKVADFSNFHVALMFFENSTRTRFSFEYAINKLKAHPYVFDNSKSSTSKGEEFINTINNLAAIGIDSFIIRTKIDGLIEQLKNIEFYKPVHFINAGDGKSAHPTQALLDYFTMKEKIGNIKGKKIVVIGDIKHSRVAKSNIALLNKVGANVVTCAPEYFREDIEGANFTSNLNKALIGADIVMCLRIQNERLEVAVSKDDFIKNYQINSKNMPHDAILMHPGPVNRDIEVSSELLDSKIGKTILNQAENGAYVRMAVLEKIFHGGCRWKFLH